MCSGIYCLKFLSWVLELLTDNTKHPEQIKTGSNSQKREYTLGNNGLLNSTTMSQQPMSKTKEATNLTRIVPKVSALEKGSVKRVILTLFIQHCHEPSIRSLYHLINMQKRFTDPARTVTC